MRMRRGGPQGEGARGGRAYVLACVSGSAHAGVRGHGEKVALAGAARLPVAMQLSSSAPGPPSLPSPRPSAERLLARDTVFTPAALPRRLSLLARPWERPGRAALRGEGRPFCPDRLPGTGRSGWERLRSRGRRPRRHRTLPPSGLPRRGCSQVARALSSPPFSHAFPVLRPENARERRSWPQ